ncbi:MAG: proline--tRNA ligase, partial [Leptospiraceae bacterium]|nr:proline--tRNA ligase [Leptospiraceae bacterium]
MKASRYLIPTLREDPQDAQVSSHRLMMRAGLVRKVGAGLYHLLPAGLRVIRKIEAIVREEMNRTGALEFQLPVLIPSELWETSGRWDTMGKEMFRIQDRHEVWNVLGPTHEESFTE